MEVGRGERKGIKDEQETKALRGGGGPAAKSKSEKETEEKQAEVSDRPRWNRAQTTEETADTRRMLTDTEVQVEAIDNCRH